MTAIAWFLWILIWGSVGYLTVKAVMIYVKKRRMEKAFAAYMQHQRLMMRNVGVPEGKSFSLYPSFEDLVEKDSA